MGLCFVPCLRFPMKFPKLIFVLTVLLTAAAFAGEAPRAAPGILPNQFAGGEIAGSPHASKDPAPADPVNPALLKEYGFTDFESAAYTHDNRKLTVKATRFGEGRRAICCTARRLQCGRGSGPWLIPDLRWQCHTDVDQLSDQPDCGRTFAEDRRGSWAKFAAGGV